MAPTVGTPVTPATPDAGPAATGRRRPRLAASLAVAVVVLALVLLASLAWGTRQIDPGDVWDALLSPRAGNNDHGAVRTERVPRTLIGLVAGAALGAAGALVQGVTRNPIADPGLLGLNAGASLAVLVAISGLGVTTTGGYVWFAFAGALVAAVVVYGAAQLGWEGATPVKLTLIGAAFTASATSVTTVILLTDRRALNEYRFWQVGSLSNRDLDVLLTLLPFVAVGLVLALSSGRILNALALGDDVARGLGQDVVRGRLVVVGAVVLLCGSAVSLVGPIAFVGLVVPHVARALVGTDYRAVVGLSALLGPVVLLVSDIVGRVVARPGEIEAGLVVALVGAPVLLLLVRRSRAVAS